MTKYVLTLIAPAGKEKLSSSHVMRVKNALAQEGAHMLAQEWLAENEACDLMFTRMDADIADTIARNTLAGAMIDSIAQPTEDRQKRMFIADMDSTMITVECIDEIADFAGVKAQVAEITERAMRGEIEFIGALNERVALLAGLSESVLDQVYAQRVQLMPGGKTLLATLRQHGVYAVLVSGGFSFFTARVRDALGFHVDYSNLLEVSEGKLTGKVIPPILDRQAKLETLLRVCSEKGFSTQEVMAVGDGANDIPMLTASGIGVAYHAKPVVQQSARARLNHCDLSALLYVQGYHKGEWQ